MFRAVAVSTQRRFFCPPACAGGLFGVASCPIQNIDWLSYFGCPTLGPSPHRPVAVIGDENASRAYAFPGMEQRMQQHTRHFKQAAPLNQRLTEEAQRLRKEAKGTAASGLLRRLRQPRACMSGMHPMVSFRRANADPRSFTRLGILGQGRT